LTERIPRLPQLILRGGQADQVRNDEVRVMLGTDPASTSHPHVMPGIDPASTSHPHVMPGTDPASAS